MGVHSCAASIGPPPHSFNVEPSNCLWHPVFCFFQVAGPSVPATYQHQHWMMGRGLGMWGHYEFSFLLRSICWQVKCLRHIAYSPFCWWSPQFSEIGGEGAKKSVVKYWLGLAVLTYWMLKWENNIFDRIMVVLTYRMLKWDGKMLLFVWDCRDGCRDCWFLCRDCRDGWRIRVI